MIKKVSIAYPPAPTSYAMFCERGLDPFHKDAFSEIKEIYKMFPFFVSKRKTGWNIIDHCGNMVGFVADGTEIIEYQYSWILSESYPGRLCAVRGNHIDEFNRMHQPIKEK